MKDFFQVVGIFLGGLFFVLFIITRIGYQVQLPGWQAGIEQVREDIKYIDVNSNEDVMGQVVELNREIKLFQKYNELWWSDIFIPDGVDDIKIIAVKKEN